MGIITADLLKRKKEHVFVGGYELDSVQTLAGSVNAGEEVFNFFGVDQTLTDVTVNNGRLSLTVFDKRANNVLLDVLTKKDPNSTTTFNKRYKWEDVTSVSVWVNRKEQDNVTYNRGTLYEDWIPVPGMTAGAVTARGERTFDGNSSVPMEFDNPIRGVKVRLRSGAGTTPNFQAEFDKAFLAVPGTNPTEYTLQLLAINEQRIQSPSNLELPSKFDVEELTVTSGMISGAGAGLNLRQADLKILTWMTHAYVVGLYDKSFGIAPNVKQFGLYENVT